MESSKKGLEEEKENIKSRLMRTKSTADSKLVSCFVVFGSGFLPSTIYEYIDIDVRERVSQICFMQL